VQTVHQCSNCYYAKSDVNEKDKTFCIVKKELVNEVRRCGYFLQKYDIPGKRTG
jgi:hypothetical protein